MLLIWLEVTLHSFALYFILWLESQLMGQPIIWNYSIAMWFLYSLRIVLYITVIISMYSSNDQIIHISGI